MKVFKNNQTGNSKIFEGSKSSLLIQLREEARKIRRESRLRNGLEDSVHSISENLHPSTLVTMASFKLDFLGLRDLTNLLSNHGVCNYILKP